ncbi:YihY/virulence factor BrkB family protein [Arsenicicoccus sp. oral taxon 190]|uniref:YihY/virulence factor BrkB family protein n=1 Tax=Arsenicicoccus sp. oral taxon 190 TaxID=1658671 RepID=UPI00067A07D5|nr:YihY/virulence factor BrkB family protein [Arsenicicoccus sp. oral taxon 190]AKT51159.1 ribonuclease BN [Arsenicicoccus sp. oral taxon 190]
MTPSPQASTADENRPPGARSHDDPDGLGKPDEMSDLPSPHWKYALKRASKEFSIDQCTDLAAALTYYAVLSLFPAILALISLLGLFGQDAGTVDKMLDAVRQLSPQAVDTLGPIIKEISGSSASGFALVIGLLSALWSASGYIGAFGRAMNRIYDVSEGRPFLKLRPVQLLVTLITLVLVALGGVMLVVSGPVAEWVGNLIGLGDTAVTVWNIVKWPVIAIIVILVIALLYYATPNVKQPKFKWFSPGAALAFVVWILASVTFGFYVSHFGSYNKTYGSIAGVIVFLLWLWITNLALLFGAEFDSEVERSRQLAAGMPAEDQVLLPPRDDKGIKKREKTLDELRLEAQDLRREAEPRD